MIIEFHCRNFRSFGGEAHFSLLATSDKALPHNCIPVFEGRKLLKSAAVYGANGSGKSNFLKAILELRNLVLSSVLLQPGDPIPFHPHELRKEEDTYFRIMFLTEGDRYLYQVEYNAKEVSSECLYHYPSGRVSKIFARVGNEVSFGAKFASLKGILGQLKGNRLLLSLAANFANVKETTDAFLFFHDGIVVLDEKKSWVPDSIKRIEKDPGMKERVLRFLQRYGNQDLQDIVFEGGEGLKLVYPGFSLSYQEESEGTKRLLALLPPYFDVLSRGATLLVDEWEESLHPLLIQGLLKTFHEESQGSQLIFATHDTGLLDLSYFRRDQIWFTELQEGHSTDLFSLAEVKAVRKDENAEKNYLLGKYGGVPSIDEGKKRSLLHQGGDEDGD